MQLNMGRNRFDLILFLSLISISILLYQTIEYLLGGCGCGATMPEVVKAFRQYGTVFGVPISFFGLISLGGVLSQILALSCIPIDYELKLARSTINMSSERLERWYILLLVQYGGICLGIAYLFLIELFIVESICLNCTISQGLILIISVLVWTWNPEFIDTKGKKISISE
ncbi:MAG: vitamin K epoxide reductase family protein [Candidatus Thorarchaeota archaeon]